ncbi:MAG: sugar kinase [Acidobacteria bacterium]|nr:sugar kinase [Acidobacteriota bacterium]
MSKRIVLFGELLLRLNPEGFARLVQADRLQVYYTGGEANAGASLVKWGHSASMVSCVPAHEMGDACVNYLRRFGIDTRYVQRAGERLGLFYVETGASQRQSMVIYDRKESAFTTYSDDGLDWAEVLAGADWFHFTGTAPAVARRLVPVLTRACTAAQRLGIRVSCDLNYRAKLWTPQEAAESMAGLLPLVNVFVCGAEDAAAIFGVQGDEDLAVAAQLAGRFGFTHVLMPRRESRSASHNTISAFLWHATQFAVSRTHEIPHIVDRIGAGDAMTAGLIHGLAEGWTLPQTVDFGVAASCLKHSVPGDFGLASLEEVQALAAGSASGRIQR